ncbi:MAG: excinuclease ABC subunit C, partial [Clostridiales bacterium]|nr:excinuclease ABC subunit C [Candidatus Apopatocola equi]
MNQYLPELREKANRLPLLPGVYIMLDESREVIYVGKAKKLKNRVSSYFHGEHLPKVAAMVSHVVDFNVIIAESEFEALVLENSLIKLHKPHYNILLKDDKGYPFIRLDHKSLYPRMSLVNRAAEDGARYFGPFGSRGQSNAIIDAVSKALGLPDCSRQFPRDLGKGRPCLQYQMGACRGWCRGEPSQLEYSLAIAQLTLILEGRSSEVGESIREEMERAAEELRFEDAARLRDRYRAVSTLEHRQRVIAAARSDTDAIALERGAKACFAVLHYTEGDLTGKDYSLFSDPMEDNDEALSELLRQYYVNRNPMPYVILLPFELEDREDIARFLTETAGHRVSVEVPQRGDKAAFVD